MTVTEQKTQEAILTKYWIDDPMEKAEKHRNCRFDARVRAKCLECQLVLVRAKETP